MTYLPFPKNVRFLDITGHRYGMLLVIGYRGKAGTHQLWECKCDCGGTTVCRSNNLRTGHSKACGCLQPVNGAAALRTHGQSGVGEERQPTPEYACWLRMKSRCLNPKNKSYARYGGRGIKICERWLEGEDGLGAYECFFADMGNRPSSLHSIERRDYNGDYEPSNCEWATQTRQQRNRCDTVRVTVGDKVLALADACELLKVKYNRVRDRMQRGWSFQRAVSEPPHWRGA